jgi:hypothetical protein
MDSQMEFGNVLKIQANLTKFSQIEDAGQVLAAPTRQDTIGDATMSEKIVSKPPVGEYIADAVNQLPIPIQRGLLHYVERLMEMKPEDKADLQAYLEKYPSETYWGDFVGSLLIVGCPPDHRDRFMKKAGIRHGAPIGVKEDLKPSDQPNHAGDEG